MASPGDQKLNKNDATAAETQATMVKKIGELKKKILLAEGQQKAYQEEGDEERKFNSETIADLKKTIKDLSSKLRFLNRPSARNFQPTAAPPPGTMPTEVVHKVDLPPGAFSVADAVQLLDWKCIDLTKQIDLNHDRYLKKQKLFKELVAEYQSLFSNKNPIKKSEFAAPVPETVVEDNNTKLVCHLENEIHRTTVQWNEAEHVRKKYRSIKGSLMADSENFESSLGELEEALIAQEAELDRLKKIYEEAVEMRDATKLVLMKQEQQANSSSKMRDKQALEFRRQVDERKSELERLERKIFSSGKTLMHQDSVGSGSGDLQTGKTEPDSDPLRTEADHSIEVTFRRIMEATGATETKEVLTRFMAQREATTRLNFLRNSTETAKKDLEEERETLTANLDAFRFADIKENEVNQEEVEGYKERVAEQRRRQEKCTNESKHTVMVIASIKDNLLELLLKLREVDELTERPIMKKVFEDYGDTMSMEELSSGQMLKMLQEALRLGLMASGQMTKELEREMIETEEDLLEISIPPQSPTSVGEGNVNNTECNKRTVFPTCYINLLANRGTGAVTACSPGQPTVAAASDDEEVPSRQFLKRQAQLITDSKSRRKGFRGVQFPKKK